MAIRVEDIGKRFHIRQRSRILGLHEALEETVTAPLRALTSRLSRPSAEGAGQRRTAGQYLWALRHVSFAVSPGEALGIVGPNGAGKSVLLRVLSRVTRPTEGRAELHGRVGSILLVGTGFHPELTGRENIYLNGAILGLTKAAIDRKFDDIVAFAEVAPFLDTPLKHYSSGMQVRLGFAVAVHLDADILLIDEVLAVADEAFQQKCQQKLQQVKEAGRTVLIVSHNMELIQNLCARAILLEQGRILLDGPAEEVALHYLELSRARSGAGR